MPASFVKPEIVLQRHGGQGPVFFADLEPSLASWPGVAHRSIFGQAADGGELVNDDDLLLIDQMLRSSL